MLYIKYYTLSYNIISIYYWIVSRETSVSKLTILILYIIYHIFYVLYYVSYTEWFFLTGPPDFQYQKEKQVAANQD